MRPLRILTWHVHGRYLEYLTQGPHHFFLPVDATRSEGHGGRSGSTPWGGNVYEIPVEEVRHHDFDVILYQSHRNWLIDRERTLGPRQAHVAQVYLEHDPPRETPTDTRHPVDDPNVLVVHCTHFNRLMWDCGRSPTAVIDHGVPDRGALYTGERPCGLVVINGLKTRGRRLGADIFERARAQVPLDLVGMQSEQVGGLGEVAPHALAAFAAPYRFFFHPVRYTSLGLALLEAMMIGMPVVGLATTELPSVIQNGVNGFIATDEDQLIDAARALIADPALARTIGGEGRKTALERYNIGRFTADWTQTFNDVAGRPNRRAP